MRFFEAAAFPAEFTPSIAWELVEVEPGVEVRYPTMERTEWSRLLGMLESNASALKDRPVAELVGSIGRTAERFLDPEDPVRHEAVEWLVPTADISAEMAVEVLDGMVRDWTADRLFELLERELGAPEILDGFHRLDSGRTVHASGPSLTFHVGAGTVPGVSVTSMIRALLVKSAVLLKPGRGDVVLPVLFARALSEEDEASADGVAVAYWPGGAGPAEEPALETADVVVAYGSSESVAALKARTPATSRFVAYHHRVSLGMVGRNALSPKEAGQVAKSAARAVSLFDQRGCVSPHVLYAERGGAVDPAAWAGALAEAMGELEAELPGGRLTADEVSSLHQLRGVAELEEAAGTGSRLYRGESGSWTVIFQERPTFTISCQNRVVYVKAVEDLAEVPELLSQVGRHLQTVAVAGAGERRRALAEALGRVGATRITSFEHAPWPPPWWHHDGGSVFSGLLSWIDLEDD